MISLPAAGEYLKLDGEGNEVFEESGDIQTHFTLITNLLHFLQGCTFVVIFGLPGDKHDDDPARAVTTGYRILDALHTILEIT